MSARELAGAEHRRTLTRLSLQFLHPFRDFLCAFLFLAVPGGLVPASTDKFSIWMRTSRRDPGLSMTIWNQVANSPG
jgi:hypothetical protein